MGFIQDALKVATISALKALTSSSSVKRMDGAFYAVDNNGSGVPSWYLYSASSTATENLPKIVSPTDTTGRFIQFAAGTDIVDLTGRSLCTGGCTLGGKAFHFYSAHTTLQLRIEKGFDIDITTDANSIQLHKWSQEPDTNLTGRIWVADLPNTGGNATVTIDSTHRWISIFAKNPANSNQYDGVCFTLQGNTITLIGFS